MFEHASLAMLLTRNRCIVRCNRAFAQLFGRSSCHEMVGQSASILFDSLDAYERFGRVVSPVLGCGQVFRGEQMFARADKARLQCVVSASAVNPLDPDSGTIWVLDDDDRA